jgi:hypothetical protein|tara:strand:- start:182 stop:382 length:201 start_codon:yes stop_codon:yes gene_type:complete
MTNTVDMIKQVCIENIADKMLYEVTDGTKDIYVGRQELATQILHIIDKLERPSQEEQANKLNRRLK